MPSDSHNPLPVSDDARVRDWTVDPETGRSNSSPQFQTLCVVIEHLIRNDAAMLISGRADRTAALILAQLAHVHGLAPSVVAREALEAGER